MERLKNVMLLKRMMTVVMIMMIVVLSGAGCAVKKSESDEKNETNQQAITDTAKEDAPQENESSKMTKEDTMEYQVAVLKGPTGIGFVKAWDDSENSKTLNTYNCTAYGTADEITAGIIKGDIDLAAVPCNLASVLYQKTGGKIKIAAINTLGVLYILSTSDEIKSVEDLKGKTIYTTGQGTTPEYTLNYILKQNHLTPGEDVTIEYKSEAAEVAALMSESDDVIAMLPQPYVTTVLQKNENMKIVLDMTKEWNQVSDETLVTGVVIARDEVIEKNEKAFEQFLTDYENSVQFATENLEETAKMADSYDIIKEAVAKQAIPYCNICFIKGDEMKSTVKAFLGVLYEANPQSVGGEEPDDDFYYVK